MSLRLCRLAARAVVIAGYIKKNYKSNALKRKKSNLPLEACCARQDLGKFADLVPPEAETRVIRETYCL